MTEQADLIPAEQIEQAILLLRGQKVMLDSDLAAMYGVEVKQLKRAVKRNLDRFPADFMFQLTADEASCSRRQIGTLKRGHNVKYLRFAFKGKGCRLSDTEASPTMTSYQRVDHEIYPPACRPVCTSDGCPTVVCG
jgi:hypothetical protein